MSEKDTLEEKQKFRIMKAKDLIAELLEELSKWPEDTEVVMFFGDFDFGKQRMLFSFHRDWGRRISYILKDEEYDI